MKLSAKLLENLISLSSGNTLSASLLNGEIYEQMRNDGILIAITHGSRKSYRVANPNICRDYLENKFNIRNLEQSLEIMQQESPERAAQVAATGDSKFKKTRTFTGFLVNTIQPIAAKISGRDFTIDPICGTFVFISDYEHFTIEDDVIIVGFENAENFRLIDRQKHLFDFAKCLFVSRYPQNQSKDFINWLLNIRNPYYHFGDYDFAGLNIFVNEYQKHLPDRAHLFVPKNLEHYFELYGNRELFYNQKINFDINSQDDTVKNIYNLINKYQKGLEQEALIM